MKNRHTQYARDGTVFWPDIWLGIEGFLQEGDEASDEGWATEYLQQDRKKSSDCHGAPFSFEGAKYLQKSK